MKVAPVLAAVVLAWLAPQPVARAASWLDAMPGGWNAPGGTLPEAPPAERDNVPRCRDQVRPPSGADGRAVETAGWMPVGSLEIFGDTSVVTATSAFDGMCRWWSYQVFVFAGGRFAGTLSPVPMNSRTDGAAVRVQLDRETGITVEYLRYAKDDPLCCPSRTSVVSFRLERRVEGPVVVPVSVSTSSSGSP
jgi:hypothetical protein